MVITIIKLPGQLIMLSVSLIPYLLNKKKITISLVLSLLVRKEARQMYAVPIQLRKEPGEESAKCSVPGHAGKGKPGGPGPWLMESLPPLGSSRSSVLSSARHCDSYSSSRGPTV